MMKPMKKADCEQALRLYEAIEKLNEVIEFYSEEKPGPAYITCRYYKGSGQVDIQFGRSIMVDALYQEKARYIASLNDMGIDYIETVAS